MKPGWALTCTLALAAFLSSCTDEAPVEADQVRSALLSAAGGDEETLENVYGLFVGIDRYQFSRAQLSSAEFEDLRGAVGDTRRFKAALRDVYGLELDEVPQDDCRSENALSSTLLDACATRDEILSALDQRIEALGPGDTLLFYFAGHGSQYRDDENFDQDSGYNGTILPYDARNPDGSPGEIFDIELKRRKDRATAKGIYFVSVFDSCNSGTATRDGASGQSRSVPVSTTPPPVTQEPVQEPVTVAADEGYWVHLAAAQDGQEAQEAVSGEIGERAGVFTNALIETLHMPAMRHASFGDIISEVQLRVSRMGHTAQVPSAEGELTAALGSRAGSAIVFNAQAQGDAVTLEAGSLSGMTIGSRFALYHSQTDAIARENSLGTAAIAALTPTSARLELESEPGDPLPQQLFAEEIAHFFAPESLQVSNRISGGVSRGEVSDALAEIAFVAVVPSGAIQITSAPDNPASVRLQASDGTLLAELGDAGAPTFVARLEAELTKIARVNQLLSLRTTTRSGDPESEVGPVEFCIAQEGYRASSCPAPDAGGIRQIALGDMTFATVINRGREPLFVYVLAIDPLNGVIQVLPQTGEIDAKLEPDRPYQRGPISFAEPGAYRFVTIASDQRIRVDALRQSGSGMRDIAACRSPLERLLCSASKGTRDPSVGAVGNWLANVSSAVVS
ncbi:caspase family protein [Erythrobacter sp. JK5]|uniref:caspase family protein n=1 Tax=Erythrobacter sp. JK5 TaxID=2829500 RepID=UPI001BAB1895|nr:caspase family protein [Erythrobacter sp. JK5]QUL37967.1 caspase family protein [Erythrobacter sp. JK5]